MATRIDFDNLFCWGEEKKSEALFLHFARHKKGQTEDKLSDRCVGPHQHVDTLKKQEHASLTSHPY